MTTTLIAAALSAATNLTTTLPTVIVEASRTGKHPLEMAQHVETLDERAIAASDAKNLPELASRLPGLNVYHVGCGNPALAQIQMRGYGVASVTGGENAWYPAAGRSFMFTVRYEF